MWCLQSHLVCITYHSPHSACLGASPWHRGAPTVLIRVYVSGWHQPAALTYALYLQSSITALSSQQSENMALVLSGLRRSSSCSELVIRAAPSRASSLTVAHVVETSNGLRMKLESLSFCCALSSLTAQKRDRVWCVFWRPAALSTQRPPVRSDTMEAERLRVTERRGRVVRKGGSLHPCKKKKRKRDRQMRREREREREAMGLGGWGGVS